MKNLLLDLVIAAIPHAGRTFRLANGFAVGSVGSVAFEVSNSNDTVVVRDVAHGTLALRATGRWSVIS
jgi:hypothetical protein